MVLFLRIDVVNCGVLLGNADAERTITLLPFKWGLTISLSHLDEPPFSSWTALATAKVAGSEISKCTWSVVPPTARALNPFFRAIPPRNDQRRSFISGPIVGARSLVEKTMWTSSEMYVCDMISRPYGTTAFVCAPALKRRAIGKCPSGTTLLRARLRSGTAPC